MSTIRATYVQHGSSTVPNITLNASGQVIVASGIVSSGTFAAPSGSVSAPGVYFVGDTNTGLYSPDADQVAISTNGTGRFFINSAGRADVVSTSSVATNITSNQATTYLQLTNSTDAAGILSTGTSLGFFTSSSGTERMRLTSTGLGIGTTSPQTPFVCSNAGANGFEIDPGQSSGAVTGVNSYNRNTSAFTPLRLNASEHRWDTSSTERARIDSSGRLLVGTSSARSVFFNFSGLTPGLQIEGTSFQNRNISIISSDNSVFNADSGIILARQKSGSIGGNTIVSNGDALGLLSFQGSDGADFVEAARIEAFVDGAPGTDDMPGRLVFSTTADGASSPTERMRIANDGKMGFGTTTLTGKFNFDGSLYLFTQPSGAGNSTLKWNSSTGAVTYDTSSRLVKENIEDCPYGLVELSQLKPRKYFRTDDQKVEIGFVADEVADVLPEFVPIGPKHIITKNEADTEEIPLGVNYEKLTAVLTKALQETIGEIESLKARVAALESA